MSSVHCGTSSYSAAEMTWVSALPKSLAIARSFLLIGIPHRDHTTSFTSRGPNECDNTATQLSEGEVARLAVIPAVVRDREVRTGEDESGVLECEALLRQRPVAFA